MNSFSISLPSVLSLPFSPAITFTTMINAAPAPASNHLRRSGAAKSLLSAPIVFTLALIVVFAPPLHRFAAAPQHLCLMFIPSVALFVS